MQSDRFHLQRFLDAQATTITRVQAELKAGEKRSHWMWFIFPQIAGLGASSMAQVYAISDLEEAKAYLNHPVLGERLRECTKVVNDLQGQSVGEIFGYPDDLKFRSSMTLFAEAATTIDLEESVFTLALRKYFDGIPDQKTLNLL